MPSPSGKTDRSQDVFYAGYSVARRVVGPDRTEHVLAEVFGSLEPDDLGTRSHSVQVVRRRAFARAAEDLLRRGVPPAVPSTRTVDSRFPEFEPLCPDASEVAIAALTEDEQVALLTAHDLGVPTAEQGGDRAGLSLVNALLKLGGEDPVDDADASTVTAAESCLGIADRTGLPAEWSAPGTSETAVLLAMRRGARRVSGVYPSAELEERITAAANGAVPAFDEPLVRTQYLWQRTAPHAAEEPAAEESAAPVLAAEPAESAVPVLVEPAAAPAPDEAAPDEAETDEAETGGVEDEPVPAVGTTADYPDDEEDEDEPSGSRLLFRWAAVFAVVGAGGGGGYWIAHTFVL